MVDSTEDNSFSPKVNSDKNAEDNPGLNSVNNIFSLKVQPVFQRQHLKCFVLDFVSLSSQKIKRAFDGLALVICHLDI